MYFGFRGLGTLLWVVVFTSDASRHRISVLSYDFADVRAHRAWSIGYLVSLFPSYPMSLGIRELAHWRGIGFRIKEDDGISGWF